MAPSCPSTLGVTAALVDGPARTVQGRGRSCPAPATASPRPTPNGPQWQHADKPNPHPSLGGGHNK
eukprot:CAMPEP_0174328410 /NCGR_PEP_ID=MMETSP0810-20121108/15122_1 /TAXON_ID=73025 ORGANISM="Eutreptiella gymnastica-like, Strain CCMP1594" /NCGR_SAMPLE_ID=MMETSP0810 /ASSEMBLY_ACC=CAM_ASM_000659 /LENGTH=65 /DNA_ID=CAMNT_0015442495 /DNA_START=1186 /DNA_END=1383 /DNA_ORIENTATION=+